MAHSHPLSAIGYQPTMIDFTLTDEQREFRDMAHKFAEKTIRPCAPEADEKEDVQWEVIEKAHQA